jgi:hypothetical protein
MERQKKTTVIAGAIVILFIGLLMVVTIGSKDSELNQTERALDAFRKSLPADLLAAFDSKDYEKAKILLKQRTSQIRKYAELFPVEKRKHFMKAEYDQLDPELLKKIPADLLDFWSRYFAVLDAECIPGFSDDEVIDFMRQYRVETIEKIKNRTYTPYNN